MSNENNKPTGELGDRQMIILKNLINSLKTGNVSDRSYAIDELEEIFTKAAEVHVLAVPVLVRSLLDSNKSIAEKAKRLLEMYHPDWQDTPDAQQAIPYVLSKLTSHNKDTALAAFRLLREFDATALPEVVKLLKETADEELQLKLVQNISQIKGEISDAVPVLITLLDNPNEMIKAAAMDTLVESESKDNDLYKSLLNNLEDKSALIREAAIKGLKNYDNFDSNAIHEIVKRLLDQEHNIRIAASDLLIYIGEAAAPKVLELVQDRQLLRKQELMRLRETKGVLFKGVDGEKFQLEPHKAMENVSWHFKDMLQYLRRIDHGIFLGLEIIGRIAPHDGDTVKVLQEVLNDEHDEIREKAVFALGQLGPGAETSLSNLYSAYDNPAFKNYELLIHSLNNIKPDWSEDDAAQPLLNYLMTKLSDKSERLNVLLALKAMNQDTLKRLNASDFTKTIIDKNLFKLMLILGENAQTALPFLNELIKNEEISLLEKPEDKKRIGFKR